MGGDQSHAEYETDFALGVDKCLDAAFEGIGVKVGQRLGRGLRARVGGLASVRGDDKPGITVQASGGASGIAGLETAYTAALRAIALDGGFSRHGK
jgi:hypothetical protein